MWILAKHPSTTVDGSGNPQFYLLGGRKYVAGRKDCDIVITGDISISRRHATISVSKVDPADPEQPAEGITIVDTSKVGVLVNGSKITQKEHTSLKDGDLISFGHLNMKYKLIHQRLVVVTSCINTSSAKVTVKSCIQKLGGFTSQNWSDKATHLVMEKVTFTIKVVCAIACGKPIVSVKYLEDLLDCCDKKTSLNLPYEKEYLPPVSEQSLVHHQLLFHPNSNRSSLMVGKLFIVLVPQQFKRINYAIQCAGGEAFLKDTKDGKLAKHISSSQTIVMQVEKKDEKSTSAEKMTWIKEIYAKLTLQHLRPIRESEIGLAILNVSLEQYCNPTLNAAPAISGSSHTQIIADSISATQQTQLLGGSIYATQTLENTVQLHHSVSMAPNESIEITSTKNLPPAANVADKDKTNTTSKRKRPIGSQSGIGNGKKNLHDFFKKPKLKEVDDVHASLKNETDNTERPEKISTNIDNDDGDDVHVLLKSKTKNVDKPERKHENIVNIEDDEDDVFSFNFSKPCVPATAKTFDEDCIEISSCTNQNSDTIPIALDKLSSVSKNTGQTCEPTTQQQNPESHVLFTPLSKKTVPDSYQPSLITPLSRKPIPDTYLPSVITPLSKKPVLDTTLDKNYVPESCPSFVQKSVSKKSVTDLHASSLDFNRKLYDDDDDDDDDPFSFSVDISAPILSKSNGKNVKNKENTKNKNSDSGKINNNNRSKDNMSETDKLASDSDTSLSKSSTDDEKQKSRFLKAISSSQDSDSEEILISNEEGNLIPKRNISENNTKQNDVDMSYLLEDDDDDLDVVSKEYSLQNQKNHILLEGFISTLDMRPKMTVIKEEDSDLIGIDTNLVKTTFVSLVVKEPQLKVPRKTSDVPGSKLKNFKTFKKQYYAGRSTKTKHIGKRDLVVFESDNIEKASLFADIREKDEEEAAENRRIDKMFDAMPRKR